MYIVYSRCLLNIQAKPENILYKIAIWRANCNLSIYVKCINFKVHWKSIILWMKKVLILNLFQNYYISFLYFLFFHQITSSTKNTTKVIETFKIYFQTLNVWNVRKKRHVFLFTCFSGKNIGYNFKNSECQCFKFTVYQRYLCYT